MEKDVKGCVFRFRLLQKNNYPSLDHFSGAAYGHSGYFIFWSGLDQVDWEIFQCLARL